MTEADEKIYVEAARDAGFSEAQWKAMFYESGPYDITVPTLALYDFVRIVNERVADRATDHPAEGDA